ncbi:MAG: T9SS type A sorting domain-containing protein, partial [Bacteroidota bacterium]
PKEYTFTDKVQKAGKYSYRLKQIDRDGKFSYSQAVEVNVGAVPLVFELEQNYPNPFNPSTTIGFTLQESGKTTLKIYDAIGREVVTLVDEVLEAGVYHQQMFNASRFASGVYFARLISGNKVQVKKLMLMK